MDDTAFAAQLDLTGGENDLLDLALGAQQLLDRIEQATRKRAETPDPAEEQVVLALLGALALRQNLNRWLRAAEAGAPAQSDAPEQEPTGLLR